ncbi:toxin-antitoxin system TumE family protein [Pyrodictium delaneyi]|uniref:toxin-antitoxin system TumE family protein n=1 Tax=Pyrodictium delaneyi TaxID=1273541 RepID=UPI00117B0808|nr:DUF6516 family protein [Pyrodictium delaneyi]
MSYASYLEKLLERYRGIVARLERLELTVRGDIVVEKATAALVDGSKLHLRQIRRGDKVIAYSYYWLSQSGETIEGWDNAPHHPEVETYPHHRHVGGEVRPLEDPSLEAFLEHVKGTLLGEPGSTKQPAEEQQKPRRTGTTRHRGHAHT